MHSLHTKCGRVEAGSPSPRPLELLGAGRELLPAPFATTSAMQSAVTSQTPITLLWMTLFPSLLQGTICIRETWQNLQKQHLVCWRVYLLNHLSGASPLVTGVCRGRGRDPLAKTELSSSAKPLHSQRGKQSVPCSAPAAFWCCCGHYKGQLPTYFTAQGWRRGELISDCIHQVASLPPWPSSSESTWCFCFST